MNRLKELTKELQEAAKAYYATNTLLMSDREYDSKLKELEVLEAQLGCRLPDSPTQKVGWEPVSRLEKVTHEIPALSLDKTKDRSFLAEWLEKFDQSNGVLSWKMDGLTVVATYQNRKLVSAITRGNGFVGENILHNAMYFRGLPRVLPNRPETAGTIIVRGEAVISYEDFESINAALPEGEKYMNPRNLASGSIRLLDPLESAKRNVHFVAFTFANAHDRGITFSAESLLLLNSWGFETVKFAEVTPATIVDEVGKFEAMIPENPYPTDGLVLVLDDVRYGESLGTTGKFPRNAIAFKWNDDVVETTLTNVEWSASRTGLINPVAVFQAVSLEGTTVTRASLHNVSYLKALQLGIGDTITVYKANKIIPQVDGNLTAGAHAPVEIPISCPVCGKATERRIGADGKTESLYCVNEECPAKHIGMFERLTCRDGLNVVGLAGSKLESLVDRGLLKTRTDLFFLHEHKSEIISMDGSGIKSCENLLSAIENSQHTTFRQFFYCLGIPGCGHDIAKILEKEWEKSAPADKKTLCFSTIARMDDGIEQFAAMDGIGNVHAETLVKWYMDNVFEYDALLALLDIQDDSLEEDEDVPAFDLSRKTFVITGSVSHFKNRKELSADIESKGGKVSGSVSKNTTYLISNEPSTSTKSRKAMELQVPIITEDEYLRMFCS